MIPWWDSTWLWWGIGIVVVAGISAIVAVVIIAMLSGDRSERRS